MFPPLASNIPVQGSDMGRCAPSVSLTNCNAPDNVFTQCIKNEMRMFDRITRDPSFQMRKYPSRYWQLKSLPFDEMPPDALRFNTPTKGLAFSTVTNPGQYYLVTSSLVPAGYDGVINVTLNKFVPQTGGPDFQDGSGQLTWAIGINNILAVNYTQISITMGASSILGPVTKGGGIRVKANDLLQYFVSASAAGIANLDPNGFVVCAFQGWLYPNR